MDESTSASTASSATPSNRTEYKREWRRTHVDQARASANASYLKHCETHRLRKKARYQIEKESRLAASKADVKLCPICNITYKRKYLARHMMNRHQLDPQELPSGLMDKVI